MNTYQIGQLAEERVAQLLQKHGFQILYRNWRTRYCEIDVVVTKAHTVYFVEVKYRKTANWGSGLDYISARKLRQMRFAAEMWVYNHHWPGDYQLLAVGISNKQLHLVPVAV